MPKSTSHTNTKPTEITSHPEPLTPAKPGPKTPEGKRRSAMNATRHGLAGRVVVLPTDDMNQFHHFSKGIVDSLQPANPYEHEIAQTIADGYWRLRRVRTTEDTLFALGHEEGQGEFDAENESIHAAYTAGKTFRDHSKTFVNLSIYEQRIQRGIEKATKQLEAIQAGRKERLDHEETRALRLYDFHKMQNLPYNPAVDGFVYSPTEIQSIARRRDRLDQAWIAQKVDFDFEEYQKKAA